VVTAKTQYNLKNAKKYFEEHLCVGDYYNECSESLANGWDYERLNRCEQDGLRVAEQALVMFELGEMLFEHLNLRHLNVDHLDELGRFSEPC